MRNLGLSTKSFMKIRKGLIVVLFTAILGSCFNPPEFPNVPEIGFDRIELFDGNQYDSLVLYITFKDGDGDLGLSSENLLHISYPYNNLTYFLAGKDANKNPTLIPLNTSARISPGDTIYHLLNIPDPTAGRLVFPRTRKQPEYNFLPAYNPMDCQPYEFNFTPRLLVEEADTAVLDPAVKIVKTLYQGSTKFFLIQDTLYFEINPNHFNIEVDFLLKDSNGPDFTEFDWRKEVGCISFDGRFPVLSDYGKALEGTLRYRMISTGFVSLFGLDQPMKLRIQIKDQALNLSNVIFTKEFTLGQILN